MRDLETTSARQAGARTIGSLKFKVYLTENLEALEALGEAFQLAGFALERLMAKVEKDPQPPGRESWGGGDEPETFDPGDTGEAREGQRPGGGRGRGE